MFRYGKMTQHAISAMSRLAEEYERSAAWLSSMDVARDRNLPKAVAAKLLTILSQGGLVSGARGPGGGYRLARPPSQISLLDIASLFERFEDEAGCPFGPGWCGKNAPCPLHEDLLRQQAAMSDWLAETALSVFAAHRGPLRRPKAKGTKGK